MTYLIGNKPYAKEVELYGADGRVLQLVGEAVPLVISNREEAMSNEEVLAEIKKVKAELAARRNAEVALTTEASDEDGEVARRDEALRMASAAFWRAVIWEAMVLAAFS